jgi:hypothetical protein
VIGGSTSIMLLCCMINLSERHIQLSEFFFKQN